MTENIQNLDYELIEKASEKYSNVREAIIQLEVDGEMKPFTVEIYKHFSTVSVKSLVEELIEKLDRVRVRDKKKWVNIITPYMIFLCIKHFTTLNLPNAFEEQVKAIENMINTGALLQILMHFDEKELEKIQEEIKSVIESLNENMDMAKEFKDVIKDKLVDSSLLE